MILLKLKSQSLKLIDAVNSTILIAISAKEGNMGAAANLYGYTMTQYILVGINSHFAKVRQSTN